MRVFWCHVYINRLVYVIILHYYAHEQLTCAHQMRETFTFS